MERWSIFPYSGGVQNGEHINTSSLSLSAKIKRLLNSQKKGDSAQVVIEL